MIGKKDEQGLMDMIGILDFGSAGNIASVANAFRRAGAEVKVIRRLDEADGLEGTGGTGKIGNRKGTGSLDGLVIPGVGSFATVPMLATALGKKRINVPVLCICLGMQALFNGSEECKGAQGLKIIPGSVKKLKGKVRLPQLGWNRVRIEKKDPLFAGIASNEYFYFANSFAAFPKNRGAVLCSTEYGQKFASAVRAGNFWGVQFHPEKSGRAGQIVIRNFISICESQAAAAVPSIDIMGGKAVRLRQGKRGTRKVFGNPLLLAKKYEKAGFRLIHIVDLDAAFGGKSQLAYLGKIARKCPDLKIQWGGGIRSFENAKAAFSAGAYRVVFGTAVANTPDIVGKCVEEFGSDRVWASLDFSGKSPKMMVNGWEKSASLSVVRAIQLAKSCGVGGMIISSVDADGMGGGPRLQLLKTARALSRKPIMLAGGVRNPDDIEDALSLGADFVIVGRALYDENIKLGEWLCLRKE